MLRCLTTCLSSTKNEPRQAIPASLRTPQASPIFFPISDSNGISISPNPPSALGFLEYSIWVKCESIEHPTTSHPISLKCLALLEKSMISVGQTKVKSSGQKKSKSHLPLYASRVSSLNPFVVGSQAVPLKKGAALPTTALIAVVAIDMIVII